MSVQTQIDRLAAAKAAIKAAIEGKGVTVPDATALDGFAALIEGIEGGGGGSSWTDNYTVFATGTFTPTEKVAEWAIDTGVPQEHGPLLLSKVKQYLIIWNETSKKIGLTIAYISAASNTQHGVAIGFNSAYVAKVLNAEGCIPSGGETVWTIKGLSTSCTLQAGGSYRWMLLEK